MSLRSEDYEKACSWSRLVAVNRLIAVGGMPESSLVADADDNVKFSQ
jgi:hypothetical protein